MQHGVDVAGENPRDAIALLPRRAKPVRVVAAAEEAGAMPRRQRRRLVEKEQLGPAAPAHHLAPPASEFADAGKPRLAGPAPRQQGPGRGVVNDAAIAGKQAAMWRSDDVAGRRDAVLQRHKQLAHSSAAKHTTQEQDYSLAPPLRGEGWGEGLFRSANADDDVRPVPPHPALRA